jgi:HAD superfamily hydrolase (TIGR01549 family)
MIKRSGWAVVFDLDETLVLTSPLESLRRWRKWKEVYAAFGQTRLPDGTLRFLERIAEKATLAVVTKAPRSYAERLLAFHGIELPVVVGYHDVKRVKPDPEALLLASQKLGIEPFHCIYVGDDENDVQAARSAGFTPIGVCWGEPLDIGVEPICASWDEVYNVILELIGE